jgi:hypothetical protein
LVRGKPAVTVAAISLVAVTLIGSDCASGMFRLKTKLVIKMMRYRRIGLVVKI